MSGRWTEVDRRGRRVTQSGRIDSSAILCVLCGLFPLLGGSCVLTEPVERVPVVELSAEEFPPAAVAGPAASFLGLEVEANESEDLERLEVLPGARVASVAAGGPAARAGLAAGDVISAVGGAAVSDRDAFLALAKDAPPGRTLRVEARRGTVVFEASLEPAPPIAGAPLVELYRVDPLRLRAGLRTFVFFKGAGAGRAAAEVVKIDPGSPLERSRLNAGDLILEVDGRPVHSAQDLVRRLVEEHAAGERVDLLCLRGGKEFTASVRLWEPGRRLARLSLPFVFGYERSLRPDRLRWALVDLFFLSLFEFRREEGEREYRILTFIRWRTGYGELIEEK